MLVDKTNASTDSAVVQASALTRTFGELTAVDHVTLTVNQGEIFGLIGPNGAGKSTLIKMLTTLLPPSSGSATVAGYNIVSQSAEVRRHIGYVPQLLSADGSLSMVSHLNPLTYEVDALRALILASGTSDYGLSLDFAVLLAITAVLTFIAAKMYRRMGY